MTAEVINDPGASPDARVAALRELLDAGVDLPSLTSESNNHIHTIYSFSPYTPTMACRRGREAGLQVVGSVDHDSVAAAGEMRDAGAILGMGVVTGFECRVMLHSVDEVAAGRAPFADRKLNNPDSAGVAYMTVQGIPAHARQEAEDFLRPIRTARLERTRRMTERANEVLAALGAPTLSFEDDVTGISMTNQVLGLVNQSLWLVWALLIGESSVLMVGSAALALLLMNFALTSLRKSGRMGAVELPLTVRLG